MRALPLDETIKEIDVFVLISQISNEFFVGKTRTENAYNVYKDHARFRSKQTKELFQRSEKENKFPRLYLLETIVTTEEIAFQHCVAWTKYFMEHHHIALTSNRILSYTSDMLPETKIVFNEIKKLPIETVLCDEKLIVKKYRKQDRAVAKKAKDTIKIYLTHEEYERIRTKAEQKNLSLSRYCKNIALEGHIVTLDSPPLSEYLAEVRGAKIILRQILYAYYQNGKYYPADLENIQKMIDKICDGEERLQEEFRENTRQIMKLLPK